MENNKNKKSVKFQGDMLNFCDFIQVFVFTRNHHLNMPYVSISLDFTVLKIRFLFVVYKWLDLIRLDMTFTQVCASLRRYDVTIRAYVIL